jgi:hypothetical protein
MWRVLQTAPAAGGNIRDTSYTIIEKADSAAHKTHFAMEEEEDVAANAQDDQVAHISIERERERERDTEGERSEREKDRERERSERERSEREGGPREREVREREVGKRGLSLHDLLRFFGVSVGMTNLVVVACG